MAPGSAAVRAHALEAEINYLAPGSHINRRYVAPGAELNTGRYESCRVLIRNARTAIEPPTLDSHGFALAKHRSMVRDFRDTAEIEQCYPAEGVELVKQLTGAPIVVPLGWVRRSALTSGGSQLQPPASDVHVDMTEDRAARLARALYEKSCPQQPPFKRFLASSLWRCFSGPPQDWPLAVCDGRSVDPRADGVPNIMVRVAELPDLAAIPIELPDEASLPAAWVFRFNPTHRWWYFPDMTPEEVILLKLHDSDHSRTWLAPHTAFRDGHCGATRPRESIEMRSVAFFP
jgi:hypothetical protein